MKPIIFNTEMVKAILSGNKTQTRRIVKHKYICNADWDNKDKKTVPHVEDEFGVWFPITEFSQYKVNDILYVRETTYTCIDNNDKCRYVADGDPTTENRHYKKIPSIHMPKCYARLFLKVTGVRVERVQNITESDSKKEGVISNEERFNFKDQSIVNKYKWQFMHLWDSIYSDKFPWSYNPWVFVYEFKIHEVKK